MGKMSVIEQSIFTVEPYTQHNRSNPLL
jgi:hypothetical protein